MKIVGIDIGGTSVKGIVMDESGQSYQEVRKATDAAKGKDHIVEVVTDVIRELLVAAPDAAAIGIGTAGRVNTLTGQIVYATDNLPGWHGFQLGEHFAKAFGLPVAVDNDGNAALLGEAWLGAGQGLASASMLTLGTGVGGANLVHGRIVHGAHWNGGEWGHTVLVPFGRACNCGLGGCMEQYLSGTALVRSASEHAGRTYTSGHEVVEDYRRGVPPVQVAFREFVKYLAIAIHNLHIGINPQAIILGGGLIDVKELWWSELESALQAMNGAEVRSAMLGNRAGAIGAVKLAVDMMNNNESKGSITYG